MTTSGFRIFFCALFAFLPFMKAQAQESAPVYSEVRVYVQGAQDLLSLAESGIGVDHIVKGPQNSVDMVLNADEVRILHTLSIRFEILTTDLAAAYAQRTRYDEATLALMEREMQSEYNVNGFEFGSMGGYYTFAEVIAELDSMRMQYPNLIT